MAARKEANQQSILAYSMPFEILNEYPSIPQDPPAHRTTMIQNKIDCLGFSILVYLVRVPFLFFMNLGLCRIKILNNIMATFDKRTAIIAWTSYSCI